MQTLANEKSRYIMIAIEYEYQIRGYGRRIPGVSK
jgi:hypothetical protein